MNKECQFIFLPTPDEIQEGVSILKLPNNELMIHPMYGMALDEIYHVHLYIFSDGEVREGDWCIAKDKYGPFIYGKEGKEMIPASRDCKKIISTTNPELCRKNYLSEGMTESNYIPSISSSDVEYIVSLFNDKEKLNNNEFGSDNWKLLIDFYMYLVAGERLKPRVLKLNNEDVGGFVKSIDKLKDIIGVEYETKCYCGHTTTCDCGENPPIPLVQIPKLNNGNIIITRD